MQYLIELGALTQKEYGAFLKMASSIQKQIYASSPNRITVEEVQFEEKDFNNILRQYLKNSAKLRKV